MRKGARGTQVLFFKSSVPSTGDEDEAKRKGFVVRSSTVFNAEQVLGASPLPAPPPSAIENVPVFDRFVIASGARVRKGTTPCYIPATDEIRIPDPSQFQSAEGFCSTLAHELTHWTGAKHRLDRTLSTRFGDRAYAAEELVAELGAAFVMAELGLAAEPHPRHAAYMASWLPLVRSDTRALLSTASLASRAADYLRTLTTGTTTSAAGKFSHFVYDAKAE